MPRKNRGPRGTPPFRYPPGRPHTIDLVLEWDVDPGAVTVAVENRGGLSIILWDPPAQFGLPSTPVPGSPGFYTVTFTAIPRRFGFNLLQRLLNFFRRRIIGDNITTTVTDGNNPPTTDTSSFEAIY